MAYPVRGARQVLRRSRPGLSTTRLSRRGTGHASTRGLAPGRRSTTRSRPVARSGSGTRVTDEMVAKATPCGRACHRGRLQPRRQPARHGELSGAGDHARLRDPGPGGPAGACSTRPSAVSRPGLTTTPIVLTGPRDASGFWLGPNTRWGAASTSSTGGSVYRGRPRERWERCRRLPGRLDGRRCRRDPGDIVTIDVSTGEPLRSTGLGPTSLAPTTRDGRRTAWSPAPTDARVSLWDAATRVCWWPASRPRSARSGGAQFIGDDPRRAIASYDGRVRLRVGHRPRARHRLRLPVAGRDLTEDEWARSSCPPRPTSPTCPGQ